MVNAAPTVVANPVPPVNLNEHVIRLFLGPKLQPETPAPVPAPEVATTPTEPSSKKNPATSGSAASRKAQLRKALNPVKAPLAYNGTEQYVVRTKLKLRSGVALDSNEVGILRQSTYVCVQELATTNDGLIRAKVAVCSASGQMVPMGWVTSVGKDGRSNLVPFHWARFARPSKPLVSSVLETEVEAVRLAITRREERAKTSLGGAVSALQFSEKLKERAKLRREQNEERRQALRDAQKAAKADAPATSEVEAKAAAEAKVAEQRFKTLTSAEVRAIGDQFRADIQREQSKLESTHAGLKANLGGGLFKKKVSVAELVKSWMPKPEITKVEFRKLVRKVVAWNNVKDIDNLFAEIDLDAGGTLDAEELTVAMKALKNEAAAANARVAEINEKIRYANTRIALVEEVVQETIRAEKQEEIASRGSRSIEAQLGYEFLKRSTKITDLVNSWENTNGEVDMMQFRRNIRAYGIEDTDEALDAVFRKVDLDSGGTLDLDEIRAALIMWKDAMSDSDKEAIRLRRASAETWKATKLSQMQLVKQLEEDQAAKALEEAELARQEQLKQEALRQARLKDEEKRRQLERKKKEEEQQYRAKIEQRRRELAAREKAEEEALAAALSR